jgi:hypothetical protein
MMLLDGYYTINEGTGAGKEVNTDFADYILTSNNGITIYVSTEDWSTVSSARSYVNSWIEDKNSDMEDKVISDLNNNGVEIKSITNKKYLEEDSNDFTMTISATYTK